MIGGLMEAMIDEALADPATRLRWEKLTEERFAAEAAANSSPLPTTAAPAAGAAAAIAPPPLSSAGDGATTTAASSPPPRAGAALWGDDYLDNPMIVGQYISRYTVHVAGYINESHDEEGKVYSIASPLPTVTRNGVQLHDTRISRRTVR